MKGRSQIARTIVLVRKDEPPRAAHGCGTSRTRLRVCSDCSGYKGRVYPGGPRPSRLRPCLSYPLTSHYTHYRVSRDGLPKQNRSPDTNCFPLSPRVISHHYSQSGRVKTCPFPQVPVLALTKSSLLSVQAAWVKCGVRETRNSVVKSLSRHFRKSLPKTRIG